jgi:hypothetical protein
MDQWIKQSVLCGAMGLGVLGTGCGSDDSVNMGDGEIGYDKSSLASYAATWEGYVEAYTFPSGSDKVRVVLDRDGNGHLEVGEGNMAPPATDPMSLIRRRWPNTPKPRAQSSLLLT